MLQSSNLISQLISIQAIGTKMEVGNHVTCSDELFKNPSEAFSFLDCLKNDDLPEDLLDISINHESIDLSDLDQDLLEEIIKGECNEVPTQDDQEQLKPQVPFVYDGSVQSYQTPATYYDHQGFCQSYPDTHQLPSVDFMCNTVQVTSPMTSPLGYRYHDQAYSPVQTPSPQHQQYVCHSAPISPQYQHNMSPGQHQQYVCNQSSPYDQHQVSWQASPGYSPVQYAAQTPTTLPQASPTTTEEDKPTCGRKSSRRTVFTEQQLQQLELVFQQTHHPELPTRENLARQFAMSESSIRIWFKNRRARPKPRGLSSSPVDSQVAHVSQQEANHGKKPRSSRTTFTEDQVDRLEEIFADYPHPEYDHLEEIAEEMGLKMEVTRVWFKNRRAKQKKIGAKICA